MAPVESFSPKDIAFDELGSAVEKVLSGHSILRINSGEDEQTLEQYQIYTIGPDEDSATVAVLIGNDATASSRIKDLDAESRPHRLIASEEIISDVKAELHNIRSDPRQR